MPLAVPHSRCLFARSQLLQRSVDELRQDIPRDLDGAKRSEGQRLVDVGAEGLESRTPTSWISGGVSAAGSGWVVLDASLTRLA
jgi:hypothetical protein